LICQLLNEDFVFSILKVGDLKIKNVALNFSKKFFKVVFKITKVAFGLMKQRKGKDIN